jgi:hypothetical protein
MLYDNEVPLGAFLGYIAIPICIDYSLEIIFTTIGNSVELIIPGRQIYRQSSNPHYVTILPLSNSATAFQFWPLSIFGHFPFLVTFHFDHFPFLATFLFLATFHFCHHVSSHDGSAS